MLKSLFMYFRHVVSNVQAMTGIQQSKRNYSWIQWCTALKFFKKQLCSLWIPSNESSDSFFKMEIVEILKSLAFFTSFPSSCFTFLAVMTATLEQDVRELTFFTCEEIQDRFWWFVWQPLWWHWSFWWLVCAHAVSKYF